MHERRAVLIHSLVFTAMMLVLMFFVYNFKIPNPNMILVAGLVLSTSIGGVIPGGICAVLMFGYSLFFFSENQRVTGTGSCDSPQHLKARLVQSDAPYDPYGWAGKVYMYITMMKQVSFTLKFLLLSHLMLDKE